MNKQCFRIIFSKTLQCLVVVSELAKSEGKSAETSSFTVPQILARIRPLTFSLFCALGFVAFPDSAMADTFIIQADKSAPKNEQPIILQTANGLPQVNIQTPNDKGLSHNKYSKFDVDTKGAILNNSRTNVQTQQAGMITGNPYLARGEAKVILNEVNSSDPSVLKGYVEVAGKKADVIIANPSGLHCEGCGVINSDRTTFTTGKPQVVNGNLENFVVENGLVSVSGKGLDNSRVDYTEVIAREMQANAGIWSKKETKVITGKNTVKRSDNPEDLQITHTKQTLSTENKPQFALDVGELGGMYSGKIHLIGTEEGVGVRNAGHIGASAETLQIDSHGRIVNTGTVNAQKDLRLVSETGIENTGKVENRQSDIVLTTQTEIKQDGTVVARNGNIYKSANQGITQSGETIAKGNVNYQAPKVTASTHSLIAAGVDVKDVAQGEERSLEKASAQGKNITAITTEKATLQGKNLASGKIQITGSAANLDNSHTSAYSINVTASEDNIQANNAAIIADEELALSTPTLLETKNSYLKAENITTKQHSLHTQNTVWEQTGLGELKLEVVDELQNKGGTFKTKGDLTVKANGMDNQQGRLLASGKLTVNVGKGKLDSSQGAMLSEQMLSITSGELINDAGLIQSAKHIAINTQGQSLSNKQTLSNTSTQNKGIVALGDLDIQSENIFNQQGRIVSGGAQNLKMAHTNNQHGLIYSGQNFTLNGVGLTNDGGTIGVAKQGNIALSGDLSQQNGEIDADEIVVSAQNMRSSDKSRIIAKGVTLTMAHQLENLNSFIQADSKDLTISSQALDNTGGEIHGLQSAVTINTRQQKLVNTTGKIRSKSMLMINSGELNNINGAIHSEGDVAINAHGQLINNQQTKDKLHGILAKGKLKIDAGKLDNDQGAILANLAQLDVAQLENHLGIVQSGSDLSLNTQQLENSEGLISSAAKTTLTVANSLRQQAGKISAGELTLNAGTLDSTEKSVIAADNADLTIKHNLINTHSELSAIHNLNVISQELDNRQGLLLAEQGRLVINSQQHQVNNQHGKIVAGQAVHLDSGQLDNQQGLVQGDTGVTLNTHGQSVNNMSAAIVSRQALAITAGQLNNNQGYIQSAQQADIQLGSSTLSNENGEISIGTDLNLNSGTVNNTDGAIVAKQNAIIRSGRLNNTNAMLITEQGNLDIDTHEQDLINQQGKLSSGANSKINSGLLDNEAGLIQSRQDMMINTHQSDLNNQQGQVPPKEKGIISLGRLVISTQQFLNKTGYVLSQGDQTITTESIKNDSGILSSFASQKITVNQDLSNVQGRVSANAVTITAQSINNQTGLLQGGDLLNLRATEIFNNQKGQVKANDKVEIHAKSVNNQEGNINTIAGNLLLSSKERLNNRLGNIITKQNASIIANGIDNYQGTIYNEKGLLHLNLWQQALDNQQGKVISKENLIFEGGSLSNHNGAIYAETQGKLQVTGLVDNQQNGKIHGLGEMTILADSVDNRGGEIRTKDNLTLNVTTEISNQKVGASGSFIESGNLLIMNTAKLDNRDTKSISEQVREGILASVLKISAQSINNQQGKIHSRTESHLAVEHSLNNQQGEITGNQAVSIKGTNLHVDNQSGRLQGASLSIVADDVTTDGHIEGKNVQITQQKDFVTNNHINAEDTLSITTAGNLTNRHNLYANAGVMLNAYHITNDVDGRISSADTQVYAKGNITNEGLINGISSDGNAKTVVKAGKHLLNTGKGRIYGDKVALQAEKIENSDKDYGNGEIKSAVIASRERLDIAAHEVENNTVHYLADNQVGAILFSAGEMTFGRTLNADNHAEGKADTLRNNSSVIEAQQDIHLNVAQIHNNNVHFLVEHVKTGKAPTEVTKLENRSVNKTDIVPMGRNARHNLQTDFTNNLNGDKSGINTNDPHIPMTLLRWAGWSRAGQLVYKNDGAEPTVLKAGDVITKDTPLAIRNEMTCDYINGKNTCQYTPAGQYGSDSPIWAYFGVPAPVEQQPPFPFDDLAEQPWYKESDWFDDEGNFKRPTRPHRFWMNSAAYQEQIVKWDYYVEHIRPLELWEAKYRKSIDAVDAGIEAHNKNRLGALAGKYYREFWRLHINNHRVDESKVTRTVAGQILAGGYLNFDGQSFVNERSVVIAGETMSLTNQIKNIGEQGLHRITDSGDKVFTFDKWRGGFKRYFQRKWENQGPYTRIIETPFDMPVYRVEEKVNYSANKRTSDDVSASTHHTLSLTEVGANNSSAIATISAYTPTKLEGGEIASFAALNTSQNIHGTQLWAGNKVGLRVPMLAERLNDFGRLPGQSQSAVRQLARVELSNELEVRSIQPNVTLPQNVLYRVNAAPTSKVLIETDPDFTNQKRWLSSDYMFNTLRYAPETTQKRLGDGFYEQRLIREQINRLTGRNFVGNYSDFESQYRGLMDAGITFAQKFNLRPGIALTPSQVAQLTTDIVWFESQPVSLGNGRIEQVLVPKIYALVKKGDVTGNGALLSGKKVTHKGGDFTNSGTVAGRELVQFDSASIRNTGTLSGRAIVGQVSGDVENLGGTIEADRAILLNIAGNFKHSSTSHTSEVNENGYQRTDTRLGRKGLLHVKGEDGELQVAANNIDVTGADILNEGKGRTYVSAKNKMSLGTLEVGFSEKMGGGNHIRAERVTESLISRVKGKGDVVLSGKDIWSAGAELEAKNKFMALAENDLVLGTATVDSDFEEFHQTKSGSLAKTTKTRLDKVQSRNHLGTQVSGKDVLLSAGHDVKAKGIQAVADDNLHVQAGHDVDIGATTNHFKEVHQQTKKTSGVLASGGGITFGSKSEKHHVESEGWTQSDGRSTLGSLHGNISVQAGNHAHVMGTDMITPRTNRIDVEAASVKVEAGKDIIHTNERHEYKQSGVNLAVSSPVIEAAQSVMKSVKRSGEVKNERLKQLHQLKAAYEVGSVLGAAKGVADTLSSLGNMNGGGDISSPSVKISVSVGASQSKQSSETKTITHQGSELNTGTLNLTSREGNVDVLGSYINAKRAEFDVAKNLNVESVQDTYHNRSENKNTGWSVGVFAGANGNSYGIGVEGSAQVGKGHENSDSVTQRNSYLNAEETIIKTGKDANFKGAVVKTDRLEADIKGNLNLESRQDSNHYDSKQTQAGAGFSVAIYGSGSSASANYSQNKAKVNYAQVEEQTGFHVGKGGMDVKVAGNTHLAGSVIDSEAAQDKNHLKTKSLTHTDIENRSEVEVKSVSAGLSTNMAQNAKNAMAAAASALGNKHESATSQTQSAIGSNIQIDTETPENLTALSRDTKNANHKVKAFDLQEIKEQQEAAQVAGELFSKITGDVAKAFEFEDGSKEKIVMHALAGALAAKMSGGNVATGAAAGAGSEWLNTYVTDYLNEHTKDLKLDAGQREKLKQAAQQMTALAIGAAAGAVTGGTSETIKQGALASYNAETYNRQLHVDEIKWIKENAKRFAQEESERLGHQVTEQEAMERLITQAAQEVDYAWFKKIGETDGQAQSFLRGATAQGDVPPYDNRGTFINSDGKRQSMFTVADKDEYYSTGKYSNALAQFDKANGHVVTNTLQPKVKYNLYTKSLSDGADAALKGTLHAFDHPEDVLKPIGFGIANCLKEDMCISAGKEMLSDSGKAVWQSGKDILGAGYRLEDVNYLYGKNMVNEIDAIAAVRGGTALLELTGTGKVTSTALNYARFKLPKGSNANDALPVVGETKGYRTTKVNLNNLEIEISKQNKHLENTNEYKVSLANGQQKSIITVSLDSLKGYVGTGQQVGKTEIGLPGSKERVNFNKNIGIYIDPVTGNQTPTTMGIIHYSKNGYHVVPAKPKE